MTKKTKPPVPAKRTRKPSAPRTPRAKTQAAPEATATRADVLETLRRRALALAQPRVAAVVNQRMRIVVFNWREQRWAVDSDLIDEVIALSNITPLPALPQMYMGLIHYRGEIYSVVDISVPFDIASAPPQRPTHALLVNCDRGAIAIAATGLEGASEIDVASISPMASDDARHPALRGLAPSLAVLFDPHQLLDDSRLIVNEQPTAALHKEGTAQ